MVDLLKGTKLIIWNQAAINHKHYFKALNRSLCDSIQRCNGIPFDLSFGGKVILFNGYFRQGLPVIPKGTRYCNALLFNDLDWFQGVMAYE